MTTFIDYIAANPRMSSGRLALVQAAGAVLGVAIAIAALLLAV